MAAIPSAVASRRTIDQVQHKPTAGRPVGQDLGMASIQAVVFDIGGVLLDWDPRYVYRELCEDEAAMERFLTEVCSREWHEDNDRGVRYADSCAALAARWPQYADLIWAWGERTEDMIGGPIEGTVALLGELIAAGVPCYGLTNMEAETYPRRLERYAFLRSLRGTVVSSAEGVIKPDPEIFRRLLQRFGLTAAATVFIDDSPVNIEAAAVLGFVAVGFVDPDVLRAELVSLGLPLRA
jgi:2-haloacid dehalogenase